MRRNFGIVIALLAAAVVYGAQPVPASEIVYTNKPRFRIPFRFDPVEMQRLHPREIQLHLSQDHGLRWQHVQSADPSSGRFDFEAPADGEYWFAVKTLDVQNRLFPRDNAEPGLKVVVDTQRPDLQITLREIEPGKVQLAWTCDDQNLDPTTLRLEYMQSGTANWQQVSVVPQASGQTTWSVLRGGFVAVRGSIGDLASNVAHAEMQITVSSEGSEPPDSAEQEYREPVAGAKAPDDPFVPLPGFAPSMGRQPAGLGSSAAPQARNVPAGPPPGGVSKLPGFDKGSGRFISDSSAPGAEAGRPPQTPAAAPPSDRNDSAARYVVNSRSFQIGYRIDGAGPAGVQSVELFVTQTEGRQWMRYGEDRDRQSPFEVTVPADGVYGFEFRVRGADGSAADPPRPGDRPSIVVTVDSTPPVAQLLPTQGAPGVSPSDVLIRWEVKDEHLGQAPIGLFCSPSPEGPWQQIGDWQPNTGQYVWTPAPGTPSTLYLRLTARDEAGNLTEVAAPQAVVLGRPLPSVRIMGVEGPDRAN